MKKSAAALAIALMLSALSGSIPSAAAQVGAMSGMELVPGGMAFGVQLSTKGVLVIGLSEFRSGGKTVGPAADAGLAVKDIIYEVNGEEVNTTEEVGGTIEESGGTVELSVYRNGRKIKINVTPQRSDGDGKYKAGMLIRDNSAGIGTVTFIDESTGMFAGLGHGICDADTGALMPMLRGGVTGVTISGVKKGKAGVPGELRGYFNTERKGALIGNTETGVYGIFNRMPETSRAALPLADKDEVECGRAYIYCTVEGDKVGQYEIEIVRIADKKANGKNFVIELKDRDLLAKTGGIVQGMSGSPIIQNGKLVGAVTHVMINEPKQGYGIFIENMLENMPEFTESPARAA